MKALLKLIENGETYESITRYIQNSFKSVTSSHYNDHCSYSKDSVTYFIAPHVYLQTESSFDIFGSSYTGGHYIVLYCLSTNQVFSLYNEDITKAQGITEQNVRTFVTEDCCKMDDIISFIKASESTSIADLSCVKELNPNLIEPVWKTLSLEDRMNLSVLDVLMESVYEKSMEELWELQDYIAYSPTGGEDISYVPCSVGEMFYDKMMELEDYFDNKTCLKSIVLDYIKQQNETDHFLSQIESEKEMAKQVILESSKIANVLPTYFRAMERYNRLSRDLEHLQDAVANHDEELTQLQQKREQVSLLFAAIPSDYSLFYRLFRKNVIKENETRKSELMEEIRSLCDEITLTIERQRYLESKIDSTNAAIKRLEPMCHSSRYREMARLFLDTMYDECIVRKMRNTNECHVRQCDVDKYLRIMRRKAVA